MEQSDPYLGDRSLSTGDYWHFANIHVFFYSNVISGKTVRVIVIATGLNAINHYYNWH